MLCSEDRSDVYCTLLSSCHFYRCLSLDYDWDLISKLMVSYLHDSMVSARDGSADAETPQSGGTRRLRQPWLKSSHQSTSQGMSIPSCRASSWPILTWDDTVVGNARDQARSSYVEFLATQPPIFTEASEPLEADHWLRTIEFKFDLLNYTENQKTLFAAQ
jgi:hypothetical protein